MQNYGAEYKYVVAVASRSFEAAPDSVLRALLLLQWAGKRVVNNAKASVEKLQEEGEVDIARSLDFNFVDFNELLALGYFEDDKINVSEAPFIFPFSFPLSPFPHPFRLVPESLADVLFAVA